MKRLLPILAFFALPAFAQQEAAPAPAPAEAAAVPTAAAETVSAPDAAPRPKVRPGPNNRAMTPEMKAYVDRLDAIRKDRDEQARIADRAEKDAEARKESLAAENEEVGALAKKAAELREALAETERKLAEAYAADETLAGLAAKKEAAEKARDDKQRELHAVVAAAMDERAARFRQPRPGEAVPSAPAPAAE